MVLNIDIAPGPEKWGAQFRQDCQFLWPFTGMSCFIGGFACLPLCFPFFFCVKRCPTLALIQLWMMFTFAITLCIIWKCPDELEAAVNNQAASSHKDESNYGDLIRFVRSMFFTQKGKSYYIFWNHQCDKVTNWKTHYSCFTQMHQLDKQWTMASTSNHKFKVSISGLYLKNDRASSLLIHPARMHHPFSPNLIRNTSAMFIFLYKSEKRRRDLGPFFCTPLDSGLQGGGGEEVGCFKSKT